MLGRGPQYAFQVVALPEAPGNRGKHGSLALIAQHETVFGIEQDHPVDHAFDGIGQLGAEFFRLDVRGVGPAQGPFAFPDAKQKRMGSLLDAAFHLLAALSDLACRPLFPGDQKGAHPDGQKGKPKIGKLIGGDREGVRKKHADKGQHAPRPGKNESRAGPGEKEPHEDQHHIANTRRHPRPQVQIERKNKPRDQGALQKFRGRSPHLLNCKPCSLEERQKLPTRAGLFMTRRGRHNRFRSGWQGWARKWITRNRRVSRRR